MSITRNDMIDIYGQAMVIPSRFVTADISYAIPAKGYIVNQFAAFYRNKLEGMGLGVWNAQWDCDDFAWLFYTDIRWAHYATKRSNAESIAVGVIYYNQGGDPNKGHAINTAIVDNRELIFIEPQFAAKGSSCEVILSAEELTSIWFVNF